MRLMTIVLVCLLVISFTFPSALAQEEGEYLHIERMFLQFDDQDAIATLYFDLDLFGDIYVFAFGARHLEPELERIFIDFDEIRIREIGRDKAVIDLSNVSRKNDEFYLFDEKKMGVMIDDLTILYPAGPSKHLNDVSVIPNLFYEVP